jgi:hypothetical protein
VIGDPNFGASRDGPICSKEGQSVVLNYTVCNILIFRHQHFQGDPDSQLMLRYSV